MNKQFTVYKILAIVCALVLALAITGCRKSKPPTTTTSTSVTTTTQSQTPTSTRTTTTSTGTIKPSPAVNNAPNIRIIYPANGDTVARGEITVTVNLENFLVVDKMGKSNIAGQGHIHYYKDVSVPTTAFKPAFTAEGTYADSINLVYKWSNVSPGTHTFSVQLVNNDHSPVMPLISATVTVTVK